MKVVREGVHVAVSVSDEGRGIPPRSCPACSGGSRGVRARTGEAASPALAWVSPSAGASWMRTVDASGPRVTVRALGRGSPSPFRRRRGRHRRAEMPAYAARGSRGPVRGKVRVLAVDDDPQALRYVRDALDRAGYVSIATGNPEDVPRLMEEESPHLVLLDLMLPGNDGFEVMKDILKSEDVPVIFLSIYGQGRRCRQGPGHGGVGLRGQALLAHGACREDQAALRRRAAPHRAVPYEPYDTGGLTIDYAQRRVTLAGRPVELTATEYALLYELSVHAGRGLTHNQLLQRVWGPERMGEPWQVREVVKRLRRKLGDDAQDPTYIFTEPRVGYRLAKPRGAG